LVKYPLRNKQVTLKNELFKITINQNNFYFLKEFS